MKKNFFYTTPVQNFASGRDNQYSFESKNKGRQFFVLVHENGWSVRGLFPEFQGEVWLSYNAFPAEGTSYFSVEFLGQERWNEEQEYYEPVYYRSQMFLRESGRKTRWHLVDKDDNSAVEIPKQLAVFFRQLCRYYGVRLPVDSVIYVPAQGEDSSGYNSIQ